MKSKIIIALDEIDYKKSLSIIKDLNPRLCLLKIGSVSFNSLGKKIVLYAKEKGFDIFLDLKLHDIPNTIKKTLSDIKKLPISMLTVHTSGGEDMLRSAVKELQGSNIEIYGVTVLTSLTDEDSISIYSKNANDQVKSLIRIAERSGIHGIVCSPQELSLLKESSLKKITPGIRINNQGDDQARTMTAYEASKLGANYLVIGRPVTNSKNINKSLQEIYDSINL